MKSSRMQLGGSALRSNGKRRTASPVDVRQLYEDAPVYAAVISPEGTILHCNGVLARHLGRTEAELTAEPIYSIFAEPSASRLLYLLGEETDGRQRGPLLLSLRCPDGNEAEVEMIADWVLVDGQGPCLRLTGLETGALRRRLRELERSDEMLRGLIESITEPIWCIEYAEPVDVTVSDREIIRQIFENECYWSMCNDAMARLYDLPEDLDFNRQPVALYFPRSPENEAFVQSILDAGFRIDNALSVDHRHDGTPFYVENSVHCHVEDGQLFRMWGTLRDVTKYQRVQNELTLREREVRGLLSAIADIVVMIDWDGRLLAANPAFRQVLGWPIDDWLGKDVSSFLDLRGRLPEHPDGRAQWRFPLDVVRSDGATVLCDTVLSTADHGDGVTRFVAVLRPSAPGEVAAGMTTADRVAWQDG